MSRQPRELSILLLVVLKMVSEAVVEFILLKFPFGAGDDFLGVALVETIGKGSLFGLGYSTNG